MVSAELPLLVSPYVYSNSSATLPLVDNIFVLILLVFALLGDTPLNLEIMEFGNAHAI